MAAWTNAILLQEIWHYIPWSLKIFAQWLIKNYDANHILLWWQLCKKMLLQRKNENMYENVFFILIHHVLKDL